MTSMLGCGPGSDVAGAIFGGSLRSDVTCCACGHTSTRQEQFTNLSLDIPPPAAFQPPPIVGGRAVGVSSGMTGGMSRVSAGRTSPGKARRSNGVGSGIVASMAAMPDGSIGTAHVARDRLGRPLVGAAKASREKSLAAARTLPAGGQAAPLSQQQDQGLVCGQQGVAVPSSSSGLYNSTGMTAQLQAGLRMGISAVTAAAAAAAQRAAAVAGLPLGGPGNANGNGGGTEGASGIDGGGGTVIDYAQDASMDTLSSPRSWRGAGTAACLPPVPASHRGGASCSAQQQQQQQQQQMPPPGHWSNGSLTGEAPTPAAKGASVGTVAALVKRHPDMVGYYRLPGASLVGCLHRYTREEQLSPREQWVCGHCRTAQAGVKQLSLRCLPPVLVLHAKRFEHAGGTGLVGGACPRGEVGSLAACSVVMLARLLHAPTPFPPTPPTGSPDAALNPCSAPAPRTGGLCASAKKLDTYLSFPLCDLDMRPYLTSSLLRARYGLHPPATCGHGRGGGGVGPSTGSGDHEAAAVAWPHEDGEEPVSRRTRSGGALGSPSHSGGGGLRAAAAGGCDSSQGFKERPLPSDYLYDLYAVVCHKGTFQVSVHA